MMLIGIFDGFSFVRILGTPGALEQPQEPEQHAHNLGFVGLCLIFLCSSAGHAVLVKLYLPQGL